MITWIGTFPASELCWEWGIHREFLQQTQIMDYYRMRTVTPLMWWYVHMHLHVVFSMCMCAWAYMRVFMCVYGPYYAYTLYWPLNIHPLQLFNRTKQITNDGLLLWCTSLVGIWCRTSYGGLDSHDELVTMREYHLLWPLVWFHIPYPNCPTIKRRGKLLTRTHPTQWCQ